MKRKLSADKIMIFSLILLGVGLFAFLGIKLYKDFIYKEAPKETNKKLDMIELYGYTLEDTDTQIYKKYFEELGKALNEEAVDYKNYAEIITKLFVIDFYTLNNKLASTDIGGLEFIHPDQVENFKLNAGDTLYKYVESNVYGDRKQDLPEVKDVNVTSTEEATYKIGNNEYSAFKLNANWEYVKDLGYESSKKFVIIKEEEMLYVVESK